MITQIIRNIGHMLVSGVTGVSSSMTMDVNDYDVTDNLELWGDEELIRWATDAELLLGLDKWEVVKIAQEVAYRLMENVDDGSPE
jgi:hypothetical protein